MSEVAVTREDGVAVVTLNAPDRRNALTLGLVDEIETTFDALETDADVSAVVVTGAPPAFCAGADLGHLGESQREGLLRIYEGFLRVGRSPLPTVAAVNGATVGAGINLALVCDVIVAGTSAWFDTRFLQLGLHPGGGMTWMLRQRVGPQVAAAMALFSQVLDSERAQQVGLAWQTVPDEELLKAATALAGKVTSAPPELVRRVKSSLVGTREPSTHQDAIDVELEAQLWSINQPAFTERLAAAQRRIGRSGD